MRMWVWAPKKPALDARERGLPDMFWPLTLVFNVLLVAPKKTGKKEVLTQEEAEEKWEKEERVDQWKVCPTQLVEREFLPHLGMINIQATMKSRLKFSKIWGKVP